ncbi:MAG: glycosyltransferase [Chitinispirillales bacterium]|jgi:cellulose synthase/poly-beta-1,6-N-acetylglucosamine synthase-like glycosyltransferase|nr:glycosyltransferase [Chitinispirillales bacterium]
MNFCLSKVCLFFTEPLAVALCVLSALLFVYGGVLIVLTSALSVRTAPRQKSPIVDTNDKQDAESDGGAPGVSVVIPFRNEERNLAALLVSIDKQNYGGMIEVILVNDGSTDGGEDVIKKFVPRNKNLCINAVGLHPSIDTDVGTDTRLTSKQRALDLGVDRSSHRLILFTDADMILEPAWAESMVKSHLSTGADMVFGHTSVMRAGIDTDIGTDMDININNGINTDDGVDTVNTASGTAKSNLIRKLFALLESYQLEYLFSFARAFSKLNLMGSCMGNNILVVKEVYAACGGQRGVGYTIVEDRALLGLVRKKGFKTAAQEPFTTTAWTFPSRSKAQFANQMLRWARGGLRPGGGLFAAGLLLLTQNISFLLSIMCILPPVPALQCVANFTLTWLFLSISFHKNGSSVPKILFPAYYIFMMAETAVFLPLMLFKSRIEWKNRKV